uniref:LAGLIDADG homing endonuclease n=1 Tax=Termitomyces sp. TaxID=1916073 RepID=A0A386TY98_9AGAR|nr:LAGLIDADG homing endonuclease [Termitomyces sp.]
MQSEAIMLSIFIMGTKTSLDAGNSSSFKGARSRLLVGASDPSIRTNNNTTVKMSVTRGQSAWASTTSTSETKREVPLSKSLNKKNIEFGQWVTGVTDGDGTFHFSEHLPGKWIFYFKIAQSTYNLRLLYHIKAQLGVGEVRVDNSSLLKAKEKGVIKSLRSPCPCKNVQTMAEFRVRDRQLLLQHIVPLFDQNRLLTSKYYNFELFKKALLVATDTALTKYQKHAMLAELKNQVRPADYMSPAWSIVNNKVTSPAEAKKVMTKSWLVGFSEAGGSFYLYTKDANRIAHAFEITPPALALTVKDGAREKLDKIVLDAAAQLLDIRVRVKKTYFTAYADSLRDISNIIAFFQNTMKGMKSIEYRIWARSFNKMKTGTERFVYLTKVRDQLKSIRSIRLDKTFNRVKRL